MKMTTDELLAYEARRILKEMPKLPSFEQLKAKSQTEDESDLQKQIVQYLNMREIYFSRQRMDKRGTSGLGTPDFQICLGGLFVAIECKVANNTLTKEQDAVRLKIIQNGGRYHVCRTLGEAISAIKEGQQ